MSLLAELLTGDTAHRSVVGCIEDLPWELAGTRVPNLPHTIWQIVWHLNYWMDLELRSIEGPEVEYPATFAPSWPAEDGPADRQAWLTEIALCRTNVAQLATLADARASTMARIVHPKNGRTVEWVVSVLSAHNSYHAGQIATIRMALGTWTPS